MASRNAQDDRTLSEPWARRALPRKRDDKRSRAAGGFAGYGRPADAGADSAAADPPAKRGRCLDARRGTAVASASGRNQSRDRDLPAPNALFGRGRARNAARRLALFGR